MAMSGPREIPYIPHEGMVICADCREGFPFSAIYQCSDREVRCERCVTAWCDEPLPGIGTTPEAP